MSSQLPISIKSWPSAKVFEFNIEKSVLRYEDLPALREIIYNKIDALDVIGKEVLIFSGRGPQWFYGILVSTVINKGIKRIAVYEPRIKGGVIIYDEVSDCLGQVVKDGEGVTNEYVEGDAETLLEKKSHGGTDYLYVWYRGEKSTSKSLTNMVDNLPAMSSNEVVLIGSVPLWLLQTVAAHLVGKGLSVYIYDPRLDRAIKIVGDDAGIARKFPIPFNKKTRIVAIVGDPNSGKSVFGNLLSLKLHKLGYTVLTQEGDVVSPTSEWGIYDPDGRLKLKQSLDPQDRFRWILHSLENLRKSNVIDYILLDLGGGRPDENVRVDQWNGEFLKYADYIFIVSRNDQNQIEKWIREINEKVGEKRIIGILESRLEGEPHINIKKDSRRPMIEGIITSLDRQLYLHGAIPDLVHGAVFEIARLLIELS